MYSQSRLNPISGPSKTCANRSLMVECYMWLCLTCFARDRYQLGVGIFRGKVATGRHSPIQDLGWSSMLQRLVGSEYDLRIGLCYSWHSAMPIEFSPKWFSSGMWYRTGQLWLAMIFLACFASAYVDLMFFTDAIPPFSDGGLRLL